MRILVLGGNGMAGHVIRTLLQEEREDEILYTHRNTRHTEGYYLDCLQEEKVKELLLDVQPDYVINAIGLLNETAEQSPGDAIRINSLLPHIIKETVEEYGGRLIHISTDCVFSGKRGAYQEADEPDSSSVYGRTKSLGEIIEPPHLTIRTSIIGPEKKDGIGLFHWFMKQQREVNGYDHVFWNGVTTLELAFFIHRALNEHWHGLYQLTCKIAVSKYDLLLLMKEVFEKDIDIHRLSKHISDKTLRNTRSDIQYEHKTIKEMLVELRKWMMLHDYT
ncbi:dTDP-4-dehydrorhamnose reductase family protein [Pontibacillus salicampi]|uniref:dTDP-4-dehydrorhamnose reductase n=1 Tax=Pontibacillus salicampi TaxID=1449801 RepID=A0ABV6LSQ7_9BACI